MGEPAKMTSTSTTTTTMTMTQHHDEDYISFAAHYEMPAFRSSSDEENGEDCDEDYSPSSSSTSLKRKDKPTRAQKRRQSRKEWALWDDLPAVPETRVGTPPETLEESEFGDEDLLTEEEMVESLYKHFAVTMKDHLTYDDAKTMFSTC